MRFCHVLRCRKFKTICVPAATVLGGCLFMVGLAGVAGADNRAVVLTTVERLIDEAGQAKADGNSAMAYALLREAVGVSPENSLARWQLGQLKVGNEWLSIEEAQRRAEADPRQVKYRERRNALGEAPQGQLELARWCRGNKLEDEAKFHWASVLSTDPKNKEAIRALGMRWHDGELMTSADIKETNKEASDTKKASRQWASRVATWLRMLSDKNESPPMSVINEIRGVTDVAAIPSVEKFTLSKDLSANEKNPGVQRLSLAFLSALKDMTGEEGTNSLLRFAVMSPSSEVRSAAIAELRYRPFHDFVPALLDGLAAPIQSAYRVVDDPDGSVHYLHSMYREGAFADWSYRTERSIYQPGDAMLFDARVAPSSTRSNEANIRSNTRTSSVSRSEARQSAQNYEQEIVAGEKKAEEANHKTAALNERIIAVLTGTTEQNLGSEPRAWWNWWQDYTDYYRGMERPVYGYQDSSSAYVRPPVQTGSVECFARGTPVWTKTGQRPIESLKMGDLVLAQNVKTGEIRYKPVIARTLRPAGPIVQVSTEDEKFLATRGHPLWVEGVGWRMTKELEDGAILHSLAGAGRICSVRAAGNEETYNLVIADFNTYFVGVSGILAHDNTPRRPTQAKVPGWVSVSR